MPDALTESFCERCGTRYDFKAPTRLNPLRKTRGLVSGLRNYIMTQDALSDAVGDAMRSEEDALAAHQLDAFHASFNFCIDCRQYACVNCWNDGGGRCRSCAPIAGTDDLIERFEASFQATQPATLGIDLGPGFVEEAPFVEPAAAMDADAWPSSDLVVESNGHADVEWPSEELGPIDDAWSAEPEPQQAPMPVAAEFEPEPELVAAEVEPEPVWAEADIETEPAAAVLKWDDDAQFELLPEPLQEPEPEPIAAEMEPELETEPVVAEAEAEPQPEPVAPEPGLPVQPHRATEIGDTILRLPRHVPIDEDRVAAISADPAMAARRAQLDSLGLGDPGEGPVAGQRGNVLPYRSSGAGGGSAQAARAAQATASGSFWDASAREVAGGLSQVAVQNCGQCGLSLSASARFCRRCGTRQAQPA